MKVLHFGRYYSQYFGGTERHVGALLDCLQHHIEVTNVVASEVCKTEIVCKDRYEIHKIASIGTVAGTTFCPTMPAYVRGLHAREQYDIIHLHFPDPMSHLAFSFLPRGPKLVISWHS
ncbi:MAG: glycosyltransferase, partial [Sterolibacterium sp.]